MSNVILGSDGIVVRQGIYEQSEFKKADLGRFLEFEDGRKFRYCKDAGSGLTKAYMTQAPAMVANHTEVAQTAYGLSVGDKNGIKVLLSAAPTLDQYAEGFLIVNKGDGKGQAFRIRKNSAANPTVMSLYDPILVAVPVASEITLVANKYKSVIVSPSTSTGVPTGIPLLDVTANYYFWAQVKGYAPLTVAISSTVGKPVGQATGTAGAGMTIGGTSDKAMWGIWVYPAAAAEVGVIDLYLEG